MGLKGMDCLSQKHLKNENLAPNPVNMEVNKVPGNKKIKIYNIDINMEIQFGKKRQFGTIDPNVGGWGQVVPNFQKGKGRSKKITKNWSYGP